MEVDPQDADDSTAPLRVVRSGELRALPIALFPGLVAPEPEEFPGESLEDELLPPELDPDQPDS